MTAIAASRWGGFSFSASILLASASIPGAFPVMIDVTADGAHHQEMHADGGTMSQVFVYPPSINADMMKQAAPRRRVLYIIRNARLDSPWENVPRKTMSIATRAIGSLTTTQGVGDLYRIFATTQRDGVEFNLAYIPPDVPAASGRAVRHGLHAGSSRESVGGVRLRLDEVPAGLRTTGQHITRIDPPS